MLLHICIVFAHLCIIGFFSKNSISEYSYFFVRIWRFNFFLCQKEKSLQKRSWRPCRSIAVGCGSLALRALVRLRNGFSPHRLTLVPPSFVNFISHISCPVRPNRFGTTAPRRRMNHRQASLREGGGFLQSKKTEGERVSLF